MNEFTSKEKDRFQLLKDLDAQKDQAERNRMGQFATPISLALDVVKTALEYLPEHEPVHFLEPGFGTGPFYSSLHQLVSESRIAKATGFELDRHYGEPADRLWRGSGLKLELADFTASPPPKSESEKYNLIVCNPPYVRHHHLTKRQKVNLKRTALDSLGIELNGLGGLYTYFMVFSQAWMSRRGVGAWLIPSEFMDVNYGRQVKRFLTNHVTLKRIHRFDPDEVQFDDAMVSSAVVFFENTLPTDHFEVEFSFGGTLSNPRIVQSVSADELRLVRKWTTLPNLSEKVSRNTNDSTLSDLFVIKRGLATGCNQFFVMTPEEAENKQIPDQFLKPILPSPRYLTEQIILADKAGLPKIDHQKLLLCCDLPPEVVRKNYPQLWSYLEKGIQEGIDQGYLCQHREPWYTQEKRPPAPFLCTYMGRSTQSRSSPFRFILNDSRATAANVYLMLYPKSALDHVLKQKPQLRKVIWKSLCKITPETMRGEGRVYGGGLYKLEPKELANVPAALVMNDLPLNVSLKKQQTLFL
jgi:hypothetical protein